MAQWIEDKIGGFGGPISKSPIRLVLWKQCMARMNFNLCAQKMFRLSKINLYTGVLG